MDVEVAFLKLSAMAKILFSAGETATPPFREDVLQTLPAWASALRRAGNAVAEEKQLTSLLNPSVLWALGKQE